MKIFLVLFFLNISIGQCFETGLVTPYRTEKYKNYAVQIDCQFYNTDMELIFNLPHYLCKRIEFEEDYFFFFKRKRAYWVGMSGDELSLYSELGEVVWRRKGDFSHDFTFDRERKLIWIIQNVQENIKGRDFRYFSLDAFDVKGKLVKSWNSFDHKEELYKVGLWSEYYKDLFVPRGARMQFRNDVLVPNFINWLEQDWVDAKGIIIPKGSLIIHIRSLDVLVAFDQNFKIIWSYEFSPELELAMFKDVHTPILVSGGKILTFINTVKKGGQKRSGIAEFDSLKYGKKKMLYYTPFLYEGQEKQVGSFGSIQLLGDGSYFLSTGSEYGGAIHLGSNGEEMFKWIEPIMTENEAQEIFYPRPFYRAQLIPKDWVPQIIF